MVDAFKLAQDNLRTVTEFDQLFRGTPDPTLTSTECVRLVTGGREAAAFVIDGPDHGLIAGYVAHFINELFNSMQTGELASNGEQVASVPAPLTVDERRRQIDTLGLIVP